MPKLLRPPLPSFYLHSKNKPVTSILLSVVLPYKGKMHRFKYHFGCSIETRFWDTHKQRPRVIGKHYDYLGAIRDQLNEMETLCKVSVRPSTPCLSKKEYRPL